MDINLLGKGGNSELNACGIFQVGVRILSPRWGVIFIYIYLLLLLFIFIHILYLYFAGDTREG